MGPARAAGTEPIGEATCPRGSGGLPETHYHPCKYSRNGISRAAVKMPSKLNMNSK